MRPLLILVTGDPVPEAAQKRGDFATLIRNTVGETWPGEWQMFDARHQELPDAGHFAGMIVTGSASSVASREPWILATERYLASATANNVPTLGICFGHQLLGQALGGEVQKNPRGREIGTVEVELAGSDPLLDGSFRPFLANMTHVDSVVTLPKQARVLARTRLEPHAAVRFSEYTWGVQFHPEIDGEVLGHYIAARFPTLVEEGLDAESIRRSASDAPAGAQVLRRFVENVVIPRQR